MKRICLTLVTLCMFIIGAHAQKHVDLQLRWLSLQTNGTYANLSNGDTLWTRLEVKNAGTDSITATDTVYFRMSGELLGLTNEVGVSYYGTLTLYPNEIDTLNIYAIKGLATGQFNIPVNTTFESLYAYIVSRSGVWHDDPGVDINGTQATVGGDNQSVVENVTFGSTGIGTIKGLEKTALNVYPNPASDKLRFKFNFDNTTATARVTDLAGRVILTKEFGKLSGEKELSIDIAALNGGVYYLEPVMDNQRAISKFTVLQH